MRALTLTLFVTLIPLIAAALFLGAALNYASVRATYMELTGERLGTVARRIAADAQTALSLGLPLRGQEALDRALLREGEADARLGTLSVADGTGRILFSSDPALVGTRATAPAGPLERVAPIQSAFGTTEGRVIVAADAEALDGVLSDLVDTILGAAWVAVVLGAVAVAAGLGLAWWRLGQALATPKTATLPPAFDDALHKVDAALDAVERDLAARGAG
ncbi:MAG: hypothetical protein AAF318_16095 [Pseudomonadota bacterium]